MSLAAVLPAVVFLEPAVAAPSVPGPPGTIYVMQWDLAEAAKIVVAHPPGGDPYPLDIGADIMRCLTVDAHGNVYICDRFRVVEQPADGRPPFTAAGAAGAQDVTVDPAGNIYIVNGDNDDHVNNVEVHPADGPLDGSADYEFGAFRRPWHIDQDASGALYVTDKKGLWRINPDGTGKTKLAGVRFARQEFSVGADGTVFVVEETDRTRIVVLPAGGPPRYSIRGFQRIGAPAVDGDGTLLVLDQLPDRVLRVAADGSSRTELFTIPPLESAGLIAVNPIA